jgi:tRNA(fMet)-specific endonuclease VapC
MHYLLDTNICIYIKNNRPAEVLKKFSTLPTGSVGMSVVTYGELCFGASKSTKPNEAMLILQSLTYSIPVLSLDAQTGVVYGEIRQCLKASGRLIGNNDLWIAAHALASDLTLITNNVAEFERVPNLKLENWVSNTKL